jgi:3-oxoacyl-[acyl-carrier-protein] synthase II
MFWEALTTGKSGIRRLDRFDEEGHPPQIAGVVPREWLSEKDFLSEDQEGVWRTRLIINAARLALQDAGIKNGEFSALRSGVWAGVSTTDMEVMEEEYDIFKRSGVANPSAIVSSFPHAAASEIAREFGCAGKVLTFSAACTSGLVAIISAAEAILAGEVEIALAGGGDTPLTFFQVTCFSTGGFIPPGVGSLDNEPTAASKPFDAKREGGILAEGAGMVLLENAARVCQRGAEPYAGIPSWGIANATSPKSVKAAFVSSITQALRKARLAPEGIDYISVHAPGDKFADRMETAAIKEVFGARAYNLPISSIKSMIGNPLAAAGPLQVIAAAQTIQRKYIPPTTNYRHPDPYCDLDCVPNRGRVARVETVLVNSSGVGGCIASLIMTGPKE